MAKAKKQKKKEIIFKTTLTADELFKKAITTPIKNSKVKKNSPNIGLYKGCFELDKSKPFVKLSS